MSEGTSKTTTAKKRTPRKPADPVDKILAEVKATGAVVSSRPVVGGGGKDRTRYRHLADTWEQAGEERARHGTEGWDEVLLSHLFHALAQPDENEARSGLLRVAALATTAIKDIDERSKRA